VWPSECIRMLDYRAIKYRAEVESFQGIQRPATWSSIWFLVQHINGNARISTDLIPSNLYLIPQNRCSSFRRQNFRYDIIIDKIHQIFHQQIRSDHFTSTLFWFTEGGTDRMVPLSKPENRKKRKKRRYDLNHIPVSRRASFRNEIILISVIFIKFEI
jgi:hypothetical protein